VAAPVPTPLQGVPVPFTKIVVKSPLDAALLIAVALLPLLTVIWLFVMARTWSQARRRKDARVRMSLAAELGVRARELTSLSTEALFKLREQAAFDDLTGVMRRAAGIAQAEREIARARRHKRPLTVVFVDVDGLKRINDSKGHAAGDELLRGLAAGLKAGLRGEDLVFRYGGDEFVCLLPDTTDAGAHTRFAEIQAEGVQKGIVFSAGFAELERTDDVVSLLGRADSQLYQRKANGRKGEPFKPDPGPDKPYRPRVVV
jgi:diguanylate cyclase (GGDEF)-like protein